MLAVSSFYPTKKYEASNRKSSEKKRSVHRAKHLVFKQTNNIEFLQPPEPWVAEVQPYTRPHPKISLKASSIKLQKKKNTNTACLHVLLPGYMAFCPCSLPMPLGSLTSSTTSCSSQHVAVALCCKALETKSAEIQRIVY